VVDMSVSMLVSDGTSMPDRREIDIGIKRPNSPAFHATPPAAKPLSLFTTE
jgi:hypothetical protein